MLNNVYHDKQNINRTSYIVIILLIAACCISIIGIKFIYANNTDTTKVTDTTANQIKYNIAYVESESFSGYLDNFVGIINGLHELGWLDNVSEQDINKVLELEDTYLIWQWLANNEVSTKLNFSQTAWWNLRSMEETREQVLVDITEREHSDLIIVMGAAAGVWLSEVDFPAQPINMMVFAASNAVRSGIIESDTDSGQDHVWAHVDLQRFDRQLRAFYDIFEFKQLGVVYEDSAGARVYSAIEELEKLAEEKEFEIIKRHVTEPLTIEEFDKYYEQLLQAWEELAPQVDAFYLTIASIDSSMLSSLLEPFYRHNVPVFSQMGSIEVKNGALISVSVFDMTNIGRFGADTMIQVLQGKKPRDMEQTFQSAPRINLNTDVARRLGYKLPFELVIVVDEAW